MKNLVLVDCTMKSIDYFQGGLPIINSIKSDTVQIVDKYKIGINIINNNIEDVATKVASFDIEKLLVMRKNTKKVFASLFSIDAFINKNEQWKDYM